MSTGNPTVVVSPITFSTLSANPSATFDHLHKQDQPVAGGRISWLRAQRRDDCRVLSHHANASPKFSRFSNLPTRR